MNFENVLARLQPSFSQFDGLEFRTLDLNLYQLQIELIFNELSSIAGVQYTGAPKVMHMICPKVFVMWDSLTRGDLPRYRYANLPPNNPWNYRRFEKSAAGFVDFLKEMQLHFQQIPFASTNKTLRKQLMDIIM